MVKKTKIKCVILNINGPLWALPVLKVADTWSVGSIVKNQNFPQIFCGFSEINEKKYQRSFTTAG